MAELSQSRRTARAALASAKARTKRNPDDPAALQLLQRAQRDYWTMELEDHVRAIVDKAPPLTGEQFSRLLVLLAPEAVA
jgi:hypothetical protein